MKSHYIDIALACIDSKIDEVNRRIDLYFFGFEKNDEGLIEVSELLHKIQELNTQRHKLESEKGEING